MGAEFIAATSSGNTLREMVLMSAGRALAACVKSVPDIAAFGAAPVGTAIGFPTARRTTNFYAFHFRRTG